MELKFAEMRERRPTKTSIYVSSVEVVFDALPVWMVASGGREEDFALPSPQVAIGTR